MATKKVYVHRLASGFPQVVSRDERNRRISEGRGGQHYTVVFVDGYRPWIKPWDGAFLEGNVAGHPGDDAHRDLRRADVLATAEVAAMTGSPLVVTFA